MRRLSHRPVFVTVTRRPTRSRGHPPLSPPPRSVTTPAGLDHLILGCNDLDRGIALIEERTGVRAAGGGVHPGRGTRNALLALGPRRYLEIIAPDPAQSTLTWFAALADMTQPRLVGWAARAADLDSLAARLRKARIAFRGPVAGSRARPDGTTVRWRTLMLADDEDALLPFFIEWDSAHPSEDAPVGCVLTGLAIDTPNTDRVAALARVLGLELLIAHASAPRLLATIAGLGGTLDMTS
jgi:glyoxalase-like protein